MIYIFRKIKNFMIYNKYYYFLVTNGFIKTEFTKIEAVKEGLRDYGLGSITDGEYKLEIRLANINNLPNYKKGTPVSIKGYVKSSSTYFN